MKTVFTHSLTVSNLDNILLSKIFVADHQLSILFKFRESGGECHDSHPASSTIFLMVFPASYWGIKFWDNQALSESLLQPLSTVEEERAKIFFSFKALIQLAISLSFPYFRATMRPRKR